MTRASNAIYYVIMAVFFGVVAFQWYIQNTVTTGNISTIYQFASYGAGALGIVSLISIFLEDDGIDTTEADIEIPFIGLTFPKWLYYILAIAIMGGQFYSAVVLNRNSTGFVSTLAFIWTPVCLVLLLATIGNSKHYLANRARAAANRARALAKEAQAH
jgi:hypothetical protein